MELTESQIYAIERPHPRLLWLYMIRAVLTGPLIFLTAPVLFFRYETLRYRFDEEGIHMRWGILFRRQVNLTYARIQDIHLTSGFIQRWFGLADIQVQTASGSAGAEMTIEGLMEFEAIRDFLYTRMRGYREGARGVAAGAAHGGAVLQGGAEYALLLQEAVEELRGARAALERIAAGGRGEGRGDV